MNGAVGIIALIGVLTIGGYIAVERIEEAQHRAAIAEQRVVVLEERTTDVSLVEKALIKVLAEVRRLRDLVRSLGGDPGEEIVFTGNGEQGGNDRPPRPPPDPKPSPKPEPSPEPEPSGTCIPMTDVCV